MWANNYFLFLAPSETFSTVFFRWLKFAQSSFLTLFEILDNITNLSQYNIFLGGSNLMEWVRNFFSSEALTMLLNSLRHIILVWCGSLFHFSLHLFILCCNNEIRVVVVTFRFCGRVPSGKHQYSNIPGSGSCELN